MKGILIILASGVVLWWFVRPGANSIQIVTGFIGDIIAFFQFLTGQPLIGSPQGSPLRLTTPSGVA